MKIIDNYPLFIGNHCASTSLSEIMQFYGNQLMTEPIVFGISSGLDFVYLNQRFEEFPRMVFFRTPMIEVEFFSNINNPLKLNYGKEINWSQIEYYINHNIPVLFLTDPSKVNFFNVDVSSAASHTLTVIGYDDNNVYISDFISNRVLVCTKNELIDSIKIPKPPFNQINIWVPIFPININQSIENLIVRGLQKNAFNMLYNISDSRGIKAILRLANEIEYWVDLPNFYNMCKHVYYSCELIGTGGSGFRKMYHQFLLEASEFVSDIRNSNLINLMQEISTEYRNLSRAFYIISRHHDKTLLPNTKSILTNIANLEETFWRKVEKVFSVAI